MEFIEYLAKELDVKDHEDWYRVTHSDVLNLGAHAFLAIFGDSLSNALSKRK